MRLRLGPLLCLGAAASVLTGCAVGPNYRAPPTPPIAAGPFVSTTPAAASPDIAPDTWWRLYQDSVLDRLIGQAFVANTDLRVAEANLANARAVLREARAVLVPTTTVGGGAQYGRSTGANTAAAISGEIRGALAGTGATLSNLGPSSASNGWSFDPSFDVSYEVDLFGRVRRSIEAARADAASVAAARDAVKITVAAETARAYVDGCAAAAELQVAQRSVKVVQSTYDIGVVRRDAGADSDFDLARQGALLEQAKAAIPPLQAQRQASLFELAALLGLTPSQVPADAQACQTPPTLTSALPVGDGATLLRRRPDVREAERHLAGETARIGVATADLFPTVTLAGGIALGASDTGKVLASRNISYGIGPLISWNFPNVLAARARIDQAKATTRAALASFDGAVLTALKEAEQALSTYANEIDHHAALTRARDQSQIAFNLAQVRFRVGSSSDLDLLAAEQTLINAESALASSAQALSDDQVAVFKALGGGWGAPA